MATLVQSWCLCGKQGDPINQRLSISPHKQRLCSYFRKCGQGPGYYGRGQSFSSQKTTLDLALRKGGGKCSLRLFCLLFACVSQGPVGSISRFLWLNWAGAAYEMGGPLPISSCQITKPHDWNHQSFVRARCLERVCHRKKEEGTGTGWGAEIPQTKWYCVTSLSNSRKTLARWSPAE